ncbi:MAG: outer membrane beta-barrel protein [Gemmatimonadaceae bacterium]|nr:outer membrane beta-barrel protein [Gemmatimonadaceae bacterium]NUS96953.1 outer membrane beta-barrel protein [Gemmatimonadaceae bacterium]
MTKRIMLGVAAAALSLAVAAPAHAQAHIGVSAGASFPTGDFGDAVSSGYNVNGIIGVSMPMSPIGFRGEVGWNSFDFKGGGNDKTRVLNGTANIVIQPSTMMPAKPYIIGGVGAYNVKVSGSTVNALLGSSQSDTKVGFNAGVGLKFGLGDLATFLEARYVTINTEGASLNYIPVSFGITF